jgi:hypothetical protein
MWSHEPSSDVDTETARTTTGSTAAAAKAIATAAAIKRSSPQGQSALADRQADLQARERNLTWGYRFSALLAFAAFTEPLEPTFVLPFPASTGTIRVSVLSLSAARRAL